jgi:hypothetical protein
MKKRAEIKKPFVSFFQLYPNTPPPQRADKTLFGSLPLRAVRGCEPVTSASGFGWHIFPPFDFSVMWDGSNLYYKLDSGNTSWQRFRTVALPGFADELVKSAPETLHKLARFPFLTRGTETGLVQLWTGLAVKTQPGWSILVRPPVNLPRDPALEVFDGLVESDWWFGPLLNVFRICKTDTPVSFRRQRPLVQLQPVYRTSHDDTSLNNFEVIDHPSKVSDESWKLYEKTLSYRQASEKPTNYRIESQKQKRVMAAK